MKKLLLLFITLIISTSLLASCDVLVDVLGDITNEYIEEEDTSTEKPDNDDKADEENEPPIDDEEPDDGEKPDDGENPDGEKEPDDPRPEYTYIAFTGAEKAVITAFLGELIPFAPNNEYYVEEDYDDYYECDYIAFYTFGNTESDFENYLELYSDYELVETFTDDYGDIWYCYEKGDIYIELSHYYYEGDYIIDVYAYNFGGSSSGGGEVTDSNVITNEGAGLPSASDGIYNIDFTKAEYVKNVTEQGYYIDGCPTVGSPKVLVIPVEFRDATAISKGYTIENIERAFNGGAGATDYYSVHDYYYISSYSQLDLDITVVEQWFRPKYASSHYKNLTMDYYGDEVFIGDQAILDEALAYLEGIMDLSEFDSDNNGMIDAVVMVNTLDINEDSVFNWAYRYWNIYTDDEGYYYEYDSVSGNDYLWMSYAFMHESYDENGNVNYTNTSVINTYTFIHEFGHILGADDYYDTSYTEESSPMDGCDIMDYMLGDHNAFTKINFGWITSSRLVVAKESVTLTLDAFAKNGDTIIIANNFDPKLGAYQEYYIVVYYTREGLNGGDFGYFARNGIIVYHVNASLFYEEYEGDILYDVYNNNTDPSDPDGTVNNLIELVKSDEGNYTYIVGDSMTATYDDLGNRLTYNLTVKSMNGNSATITFTAS